MEKSALIIIITSCLVLVQVLAEEEHVESLPSPEPLTGYFSSHKEDDVTGAAREALRAAVEQEHDVNQVTMGPLLIYLLPD